MKPESPATVPEVERTYLLERIDDAAVAQVYADGFDDLAPREKVLIWYLSEAALWGRDIYYDQRYRHSLVMREILEQILQQADGVEDAVRTEIERYLKL